MSDPFIAEIRLFASNFAPRGWAFCDGQLLPISQNTALFSLVGTIYGGDGRTTFALPDLQGCAPMHPGRGPGLSDRQLGERGGTESVTLTVPELPAHRHGVAASTALGDTPAVEGHVPAAVVGALPYADPSALTPLAPEAALPQGGAQAHNNMQPYLALGFIIALQGVYPPRT